MAQTTRGEMLSSNLSSAPSTSFSVPESSPDFDPLEPDVDGTGDTSPSIDYAGYEGIDWNRLAGFSIRKHRKRARTGWVWEHGFDIENTDSGHRYWLCKLCHRKKTTITHMYDAASTSQANSHMEEVHHVCKGGPMLPQRKKQRTLLNMVDLDTHQPKDQALMNAFISSFDPLRFQHLLIRWVSCDNIPFHKLESPYFRDLMAYANSAIVDSGSVPTHSTIRDWIVRSFNRHKGVVTELLRRSLSRINVSFDAWSSRKFMSLLGLTVHFLDDEGNFRTFLLGLPRIEGRHCGENLADRVSEILHEYGLEDRVGYFVTDNAESNDTCLEDLGRELGFKKQHRRLRCCGHIINLVARSILFGTDADAFEEDCQADKEIQDEVKLWRSKGPIGKLHNTVHWVERSGQRIERLHKLQSIENTALGLEDKTTYDVVMDNATRWNSSEAMMERAYTLRNALDSLVQAEVTEWSQYVARRTQNGAKPMPKKCRKKPTIVDDRMAAEDWSVIAEYLAILKPLKIATKRLEGRPREGKFGAIWEVLLTMEWLLKHLEEAKLQHERDEEPYLRIGCNLGWMKLDQYYALTEDSPAYLASLVLHPAFRWSTVESQWSDHPDWLTRGRTAVQELWEEYRSLPIEQDTIPEQPTVSRMTTDLDDFMASIRKLGAQPAPSVCSVRDEYAEWVASTDPGDCLVDDPIQYWLLRRRQYPRLSRMAIDLFSIPAMSSEPERIFSLAGQMSKETLQALLALSELPDLDGLGSHGGAEQSKLLRHVLEDYNIWNKSGFYTGDNHGSNDKLCRLLGEHLQARGINWEPRKQRIRCHGHVINLAVQAFLFIDSKEAARASLEQIEGDDEIAFGPLGKIHNISVHMRENDYRWNLFKKRAGRSLGLDNDTRWNSWFLLLDVAFNLQEHVDWYQRRYYENLQDDYLAPNEWCILRETRAFLQPFCKITQLTEGRYATLDRTLFTMDVLHRHYTQAFQKHHDNHALRSCIAASWAVFDNY
ncbi:calcium permeable channel [Purpureocillium lavendulum]|uniref:Calcium permeable channel n=1 Tax=Purpureocillium lavendulum TaxID=1247861 RepID=A0AB34FES3_9HYPO|nr:calcium permeable channel [Purpureocillium lavendulum]